MKEQYDAIIATHWLQKVHRFDIKKVLTHWHNHLNDDGKLFIIVTDLKWIADTIHKEWDASPQVMAALFGDYDDPHRCAFTMSMLRDVVDRAGFVTQEARTGPFTIGQGEGTVLARQIFVQCEKAKLHPPESPLEEAE